jgi:hypothetical protein
LTDNAKAYLLLIDQLLGAEDDALVGALGSMLERNRGSDRLESTMLGKRKAPERYVEP